MDYYAKLRVYTHQHSSIIIAPIPIPLHSLRASESVSLAQVLCVFCAQNMRPSITHARTTRMFRVCVHASECGGVLSRSLHHVYCMFALWRFLTFSLLLDSVAVCCGCMRAFTQGWKHNRSEHSRDARAH